MAHGKVRYVDRELANIRENLDIIAKRINVALVPMPAAAEPEEHVTEPAGEEDEGEEQAP